MKIYLAGKVSKNGWRTGLVGRQNINASDNSKWQPRVNAIFGLHDYVGPFLYGCNHGCFHGDGTHGLQSPIGCGCDADGDGGYSCREIVVNCLAAVHRADLVFCWLEAPEDYGSMVEVGYALALKIPTVMAAETESDLIDSHWFAVTASSLVTAATPAEALRLAIAKLQPLRDPSSLKIDPPVVTGNRAHGPYADLPPAPIQFALPVAAWKRCGSPIEKALLSGLLTAAAYAGVMLVLKLDGRDINLTAAGIPMFVRPQHKVCNHRTDFMIEYRGIRAVVECDGHDYHERTKEQAQHDRELDRAFQREGFRVFRFTGREIWQSPEGCAVSLIRDLQSAGG